MSNSDIELMAHLFRRAGFGSNRQILEEYCEKEYEAVVENYSTLKSSLNLMMT